MEKLKAEHSHALDLQKINSSVAESLAKLDSVEDDD